MDEQSKERAQKLEKIKAMGVHPYPNQFFPTHTAQQVISTYDSLDADGLEKCSESLKLAGRILSIRSFGKAAFLKIQDRTRQIQLYLAQDVTGTEKFQFFKDYLDMGDIIGVEGILFRTKTQELTVKVKTFILLAKCMHPLPEKWHGLTDVEIRYRERYLDLIVNPTVREVFRTRSQMIQEIRSFFTQKEFLEVETPMMQPIAGGALARPFVTHHNTLDMDLYLRIAPELYLKRLVVGGFERVFEINRNFRNEGISIQHNPEFTMLEFYQAYATYEHLMDFTEVLIHALAQKILNSEMITYQGTTLSLKRPWQRLSLQEAIVKFCDFKVQHLEDLSQMEAYFKKKQIPLPKVRELGHYQTTLFEQCVEAKLVQPTFIYHYPVSVSPLSRKSDVDTRVVDRFELYMYGREIANGFSELNDPVDQKNRFLQQGQDRKAGGEEAHEMDEDYIHALEYGLPPTGGEGIGIDRLVMLFTDSASIRDVILFPQLRKA